MRPIDVDALMERFAEMQKAGETDGIEYACNGVRGEHDFCSRGDRREEEK